MLIGVDGTYTLGSMGGEVSHLLTRNEIPSHRHNITMLAGSTGLGSFGYPASANATGEGISYATDPDGGSQPHNNMPPYLAANIWKRIA